ncbi:MAG TPA: hypothetical protein VKR06_24280 [Ktedonosporobacter sp.]|nr:hypothetical protein [Ktedonosporobacter sp.]
MQLQDQINEMLRALDEHASPTQPEQEPEPQPPQTEDDAFGSQELPPPPEEAPRPAVYVYMMNRPLEEMLEERDAQEEAPSIVESQRETEDPIRAPATGGKRRPSRRKLLPLIVCCVVLVGLLSGIAAAIIATVGAPAATITLVPQSRQITITLSLTLVTGAPGGRDGQVQGRLLPEVSMSQADTIPTTGTAHQDARAAQGTITFYNAATYAQTVAAGTVITASNGITVVTEQDAIIPAVSYPTLGQASITAESTITGQASNMQAGAINGPCCRLQVSAVSSAFTGGQDARTYQTATKDDITQATSRLKTSLDQSVQAALQAQLRPDETLIQPLSCQSTAKPDKQPGEEATQVTMTVEETCKGAAYTTQQYQQIITQQTNQKAITELRDGYLLVGTVQSHINKVTPKPQGFEIQTAATATYAYQFDTEQQARIKSLIAGKSKAQAITLLTNFPGVQSVSIVIKNDAATLPTDSSALHIALLMTGWSQ